VNPKYTEAEEAIRQKWKQQAAQAQENLIKLKGEAVAREKREWQERIARGAAEEAARKAAADQAVQARGLVDALVAQLKGLEALYGLRVTSHESSTTIHGQQTINVQFTKVAAPRTFTPRW
jgi:hypothetical protein